MSLRQNARLLSGSASRTFGAPARRALNRGVRRDFAQSAEKGSISWSVRFTSLRSVPPNFQLGFLGFAFQGALQGLIEGGFGAFVFLLRDAALFVLHFELEDFFFQCFQQHR